MKTVRNKSRKPLRVALPGNKMLFLGPQKSGQIADQAADAPAVVRLLQKGDLEIVGEGAQHEGGAGGESSAQGTSRGHKPTTMVLPKGNR